MEFANRQLTHLSDWLVRQPHWVMVTLAFLILMGVGTGLSLALNSFFLLPSPVKPLPPRAPFPTATVPVLPSPTALITDVPPLHEITPTFSPTPTFTPRQTPTFTPSPTLAYPTVNMNEGDVNISVYPGPDVTVHPGETVYAMTITSKVSTTYSLQGNPTDQGGIWWDHTGGTIEPGHPVDIHIQVSSAVAAGDYHGHPTLQSGTGMVTGFYVQVHVVH